jgi:hypothetical protein
LGLFLLPETSLAMAAFLFFNANLGGLSPSHESLWSLLPSSFTLF